MSKTNQYYENCIESIQNYFNISTIAAKYIYHRRKHGAPYRSLDDPKYLPWNNKLLNALLQADCIINLNWEDVMFGTEKEDLLVYGINIDLFSDEFPYRSEDNMNVGDTEEKSTDSEWTVVQSKNKQKKEKKKFVVKNIIISKLFL